MTDNHIHKGLLPRTATSEDDSYKPSPEEGYAKHFETPCPATTSSPFCVKCLLVKRDVRQPVKIEAGKKHDDIEKLVLKRDEEARSPIKRQNTTIIGRVEVFKELGRDGEKGKMFNVGITDKRASDAILNKTSNSL